MNINLKALSEKEITEFVKKQGQSPYRAEQLINWIYKKHATSFDEMSNLSKSFRDSLKKIAFISQLKLLERQLSQDGTQKFLFELEDRQTIESVLIPDEKRLTLCVSSQVGCAMGCKFCVTGKLGLKRNLMAYEIVDQILAVQRLTDYRPKITNVVFMGMGEPLDNFEEVVESLRRITKLLGFSKRRVTLSTAGIIPKIYELADRAPGINLAISLNATTDEVRNKIMPVNRKYPLKELLKACRDFPLPPRRRITFEYVMLKGINDTKEDASRLLNLLRGIKAKINLIPYNPIQQKTSEPVKQPEPFERPSDDGITTFQKKLLNAGLAAIIRKSKGQDISAACGQLKASYLPKTSLTTFKSS